MQNKASRTYRWSAWFLVKKLFFLVGALACIMAISNLWSYDADESSADPDANEIVFIDTDADGQTNDIDTDDDNDGFLDQVELEAGTDPLDPNSIPVEDEGSNPPGEQPDSTKQLIAVLSGYEDAKLTKSKDVGSEGVSCIYTYEISATLSLQIDQGCGSLSGEDRDFSWAYNSTTTDKGIGSSDTSYCRKSSDENCSSGNGALEVFVADKSDSGHDLLFISTDDIDQNNSAERLTPIIKSITITGEE